MIAITPRKAARSAFFLTLKPFDLEKAMDIRSPCAGLRHTPTIHVRIGLTIHTPITNHRLRR